MVEHWIGAALAATSVGQLLAAELMSRTADEAGRKYFDGIIAGDKANELGLPAQPELRAWLVTQMYGVAKIAADGATILAAEIAAAAGLIVTVVIAVQGKKHGEAWVSGAGALVLLILAGALLCQLLRVKLSRYVEGEPVRYEKKNKIDEPSVRKRLVNNALAVICGYFQRVIRLQTPTPYKTAIIAAAALSAVIGVLI